MIAEAFPAARELATKPYFDQKFAEVDQKFAEVKAEIASVRGEVREGFAALRAEIDIEATRAMRWMFGLFYRSGPPRSAP